jgi:hypothetical protein
MDFFMEQEFIPKDTWNYFQQKYGDGKLAMRYIDVKIPIFMDWLRETIGKPITINNWHLNIPSAQGQTYDGRCLRLPNDISYKQYSEHSYGRAVDFTVQNIEAEEIRQLLINKYSEDFFTLGATTLEKNTSWVHVGFADLNCGWTPEKQNGIWLVNA